MGKYYCYRHIRPDKNVPFYVGYATKKNKQFVSETGEFERAFDFGARTNLWKEIYKKNDKKIEVEVFFESDDLPVILDKEREFIKLYGRIDLGTGTLVNFTDGGDSPAGFKHTEEAKKKISESNRRRKIWTPELRKRISVAKKGKPGTPMSEENKKKLSIRAKNQVYTPEMRKRNSEAMKKYFSENPSPRNKPVIQLTKDGEFIKEWISTSQAQRALKINNIPAVLSGIQSTSGGFKWVYKKNYKI